MDETPYDIVIIGAGSGGLTAARFAAQLGAKTALIERNRIGGDCTWTGCVPSKALLRAAKVANEVRNAARYGIDAGPVSIDMVQVRRFVRSAIEEVYQYETPEVLEAAGVDVIAERAEFVSPSAVRVGERTITGKIFLIATGARPAIPPIPGLGDVEFVTYEKIFETDRLPGALAIIGAGPVGTELAQAYRRFGSQVTLIDRNFLARDEPEARQALRSVLEREGIRFVDNRAESVWNEGGNIVVEAGESRTVCDMLLVATGRAPAVAELGLDKAGVKYSDRGIGVDDRLRTNVKHIYATGDVVGKQQFTHLAGWQAFQAVRNAMLPGGGSGFTDLVPWVTYTDPEVAHIGRTEEDARIEFGTSVRVHSRSMKEVDRAIAEGNTDGFLKIVTGNDDTILGATIVASRAGELVGEFVLAIQNRHRLKDIAGAIHPYPTYSTAIQQLAAEATIDRMLEGTSGMFIRGLSRLIR